MTKAQVRKLYGDPDNQQVTSSGETWSYFFNKGHYFIPYYFGRPRTGTFHFNEAGILTDFDYNQEDQSSQILRSHDARLHKKLQENACQNLRNGLQSRVTNRASETSFPFRLPHELGQLALAFVKPFSRCAIFSSKMKS